MTGFIAASQSTSELQCVLDNLAARGLLPRFDAGVDVFCLIEDETLRADSLKLITDLRAAGKVVEYSFTPSKTDKQFKRAMELNAANSARIEHTPEGVEKDEASVRAFVELPATW